MSAESNYPKYISNSPTGEDLFENKSQDKIANAIVDALSEENFKIIGLEGKWGSGKSNVIKNLEKKTEASHYTFLYDLWGHQEDDPKKSILIELTEFVITKNNAVNNGKNYWEKKLRLLFSKIRETSSSLKPLVGIGIIYFLYLIIYNPLLNIYARKEEAYFNFDSSLKLGIVLFPLILLIIVYLVFVIVAFFQKEKGKSFQTAIQKIASIVHNKQLAESKIENIFEQDPSVRDFRNWINDLDGDLKDKRLIIIFDNIDRLPPAQMQKMWSSINLFFSDDTSNLKK